MHPSGQAALLVFSRYPRLGKVKTRLRSILTAERCLELHTALLLDTLDRVSLLDVACHLFMADGSDDEVLRFAQESRLPRTIQLHCQKGRDLGERMWNAYREISSVSSMAVFLGSDTPTLPLQHIREGLKKLNQCQVILGPVEDGGYYLLALSEARRELFRDIDWGTSAVLAQTRSKLQPQEYLLLPPWYDVDTDQDLKRLKSDLGSDFEGFPHRTCRFLEETRL